MKKGVPVSPGVAVARAFVTDQVLARRDPTKLDVAALSAEVAHFDAACEGALHELDAIIERVNRQLGPDAAGIFQAHRLLIRDPALVAKVKATIADHQVDAATALHEVLDEYTALFSQVKDDYLRERLADFREALGRIQAQLARREETPQLENEDPVILVAHEILSSHALTFDRLKVAGIATETGGATGHAAILARSMGIPAVSGLRGLLRDVQTGDLVALDGREGHIYINPGPEVQAAYRKLKREYAHLRSSLIENREEEAVTADGHAITLLANVNGPADARTAAEVGATGVGLYRTEYLFLAHDTIPDEEQQLRAYHEVIQAAPNRTVTIRTLDLGGDKHVPYLGNPREANPFMGWRSIRLTLEHKELFETQLRAILRAGRAGKVSLLFPMVSTVEEVRQIKKLIADTCAALRRKRIPYAYNLKMGVMLEVPAAALCVDLLLAEVDFVSIGSNDLIQYVMAADRDNPKVAHLCEPFSPAILRVLQQVLKTCNEQDKSVTLCGEMAGRMRCFLPLFGMGLRRFSTSPAFVPSLKEMVRRSTLALAREVAAHALRLKTTNEVRNYLAKIAKQVWPDVVLLDTNK